MGKRPTQHTRRGKKTIPRLDLRSRKSFYKLGFIQFSVTLKLRVAPLGAALRPQTRSSVTD